MHRAIEIIKTIALTGVSEVVLFHSASGKDSIALLDLLHPYFKRILCVYMYIVPQLEHIDRYIRYAQKKYPKAEFIQVPHYALPSYHKAGYMGCEVKHIKKYNLTELSDIIRERYGIKWACFGFKMADSMNRRLMLRNYRDNAITEQTHKFFPLSEYKNADVMAYIERNNLIRPEIYGKTQSSGTNIADINYLLYLRENYPNDLRRVISVFPMVERKLFEYDYKAAKTDTNTGDITLANKS